MVLALAMREVETALEDDLPIMLQCAFDDTRWPATIAERHRIGRLKAEDVLVANSGWLRLSPGFAELSHRS
jgi:hypothetical protein